MLAFKTFCRVLLREATTLIVKNWFNLLLVIGLFQFLSQNQMDFEFTFRTSTVIDQLANRSLAEPISLETRIDKPRPEESRMSLGSFSLTSKKSNDESTNQISSKTSVQRASNPSFLSFVFNDDSSGEHPVDSSILNYHQKVSIAYVKRFAPVAISEMHKYGIPASIKLAQALLESNVGTNQLSNGLNNHFGIKCFSKNCKTGHCKNSEKEGHKHFYRNYENAWASFRGHSLFLQTDIYKHLNSLDSSDYKKWAFSLKEAGYSTDQYYAEKLIKIIEVLNLDRFDQE